MNLQEQVARLMCAQYCLIDQCHKELQPCQAAWEESDAILSLIIKELTVIGDEEILQARLNRDDTTGFIVDDDERRIAQRQHDHHIKQLRRE